MSRLLRNSLNQKAVLWVAEGVDNYGSYKVNSPVEISVRWEENRNEVTDNLGNTIVTDAVIHVNREIVVGSILWLGELIDVATPPVNLKQVVIYEEVPNLKARTKFRSVSVIKFSDTLPTLN